MMMCSSNNMNTVAEASYGCESRKGDAANRIIPTDKRMPAEHATLSPRQQERPTLILSDTSTGPFLPAGICLCCVIL